MHRNRLLVPVSLALLCLLPSGAYAAKVSITQKCDYDCLKSACANVGGRFSGSVENGYLCVNDKKGTSVGCYKSVCTGTVPNSIKGAKGTIGGILQPPLMAR